MIAEHDARYRKKIEMLTRLNDVTDDIKRAEILAEGGQWGMAAEALETLVSKEPDKLEFRLKLVEALLKSGDMSRFGRAYDDMVERFGNEGSPYMTRVELAKSLVSIGRLLGEAEHVEQADRAFEQVFRRGEELAREGMLDGKITLIEHGTMLNNDVAVGIFDPLVARETSRRRPAKALRARQVQLAIWDAIIPYSRDDAVLAQNRMNVLLETAELQHQAGQESEALATIRRTEGLASELLGKQPDDIGRLTEWALDLARVARQERRAEGAAHLETRATCLEACRRLERHPELTTDWSLYGLACCYSMLSEVVPDDQASSSSERVAMADQAIATLRRAVVAGLKDAGHMRLDTKLDSIRGRPDFQNMLLDLDFPVDPFTGSP